MKNQVLITSDGMNVHIHSTIRAAMAGKVILTVLNLAVLTAVIYGLSHIEGKDAGKMLIPVILMFIVLVFFPWKYWFWNFFGNETIVVTTKVILIQHDYGIVQLKPKQFTHSELAIQFEPVKEFDGMEYGKLIFVTYAEETNLAEVLCASTVLMPRDKVEEAAERVVELYNNEEEEGFFFSAN